MIANRTSLSAPALSLAHVERLWFAGDRLQLLRLISIQAERATAVHTSGVRQMPTSNAIYSIGVPAAEHFDRSIDDDLDIEPHAPVVNVPKVQRQAHFHRLDIGRFAALPIYLSPAG